jgi:hypothetical protein
MAVDTLPKNLTATQVERRLMKQWMSNGDDTFDALTDRFFSDLDELDLDRTDEVLCNAIKAAIRRGAARAIEFVAKQEPPVLIKPDPVDEDGQYIPQPFAAEMPDGSIVEEWDEELRKQGAVALW